MCLAHTLQLGHLARPQIGPYAELCIAVQTRREAAAGVCAQLELSSQIAVVPSAHRLTSGQAQGSWVYIRVDADKLQASDLPVKEFLEMKEQVVGEQPASTASACNEVLQVQQTRTWPTL